MGGSEDNCIRTKDYTAMASAGTRFTTRCLWILFGVGTGGILLVVAVVLLSPLLAGSSTAVTPTTDSSALPTKSSHQSISLVNVGYSKEVADGRAGQMFMGPLYGVSSGSSTLSTALNVSNYIMVGSVSMGTPGQSISIWVNTIGRDFYFISPLGSGASSAKSKRFDAS